MNLRGCRAVWLAAGLGVLSLASCFSSNDSEPGPDAGSDGAVAQDDGGGPADSPGPDATMPPDAGSQPSPEGSAADGPTDAGAADQGVIEAASEGSTSDASTGGKIAPALSGTTYGAASADGTAMLVVASGAAFWWSHYEPASGWSAPAQIAGLGRATTEGQLGIDGSGNAFLVWMDNISDSAFSHYVYGVVRYDHASNAWGAPMIPDTTGKSLWQTAALSVNASGEALVVDPPDPSGSPGSAPLYAQHYAGGTWTQETVLSGSDTYSFPTVTFNAAGLAVATVVPSTTGGTVVATRAATGVWTQAAGVVSPIAEGGGAGPSATINASGDVLVGWLAGGSSAHPAAYQYSASTQLWTGPTALSTENETALGGCPVGVALTPSGDGVLTRCYYGPNGNSKPALEAYTFTKSTGTWSPTPADATLAGWPDLRSVAFDLSASGFVAFVDQGSAGNSYGGPIHVVPFTLAGGWGAESPAESPDGSTPDQAVVTFVAPDGSSGWVSWSDGANTWVEKVK